jgi:small subunit ribosomal protein S19e
MSRRSVTVKDVPADEFIKACADYLKRQPKFDVPKFHDIVKTGVHKELAPYDEDWFYIRAASVARKVYLRSGTGVGALKKWYGGSNSAHRGTKKAHFSKAGGAIIRKAMAELAKLDLMDHAADGGRVITSKGRAELDRIAGNINLSVNDLLH